MNTKPATLEELLEAIENHTSQENSLTTNSNFKKKSKHYNKINKFIKENNITKGILRIPLYRIVHEYYKWAENHDTRPTPYELSRVMKEHFTFIRSGAGRYFLLNEFCDMSVKAKKSSKSFYKRNILNKRVKNDKKKDEVCEPQSEIKPTV